MFNDGRNRFVISSRQYPFTDSTVGPTYGLLLQGPSFWSTSFSTALIACASAGEAKATEKCWASATSSSRNTSSASLASPPFSVLKPLMNTSVQEYISILACGNPSILKLVPMEGVKARILICGSLVLLGLGIDAFGVRIYGHTPGVGQWCPDRHFLVLTVAAWVNAYWPVAVITLGIVVWFSVRWIKQP